MISGSRIDREKARDARALATMERMGWRVLPVVGHRSRVRLECPHCDKSVVVERANLGQLADDYQSKDEKIDGTFTMRTTKAGEQTWMIGMGRDHPLHHALTNEHDRNGDAIYAAHAVTSVYDFARELDNVHAEGDPADLRAILRHLATAIRPYAPAAADELEGTIVKDTRKGPA